MVLRGRLTRFGSAGSVTVWTLLIVLPLWVVGCPKGETPAEVVEESVTVAVVTEETPSAAAEHYFVYEGEDPAYMTLNTKPWSTIFVDGKKAGNTPKKRMSIEPGEHEVILACGPCEEVQKKTLVFNVKAGETYTSVKSVFGDGVDADEVEGAGGAAEPAQPYRESDQAYLTLNAKPWSRIYLDGKLVGHTPKNRFAIVPGEHEVLLQCGPCGEEQEKTLRFTVAAGETYTSVKNVFEP